MIALALDSATDRCTVSASGYGITAVRHVDGARTHASAVLGLATEVLAEIGSQPSEITDVFTGDGPGSFTGLRVATAVAKALVWRREVAWWTAPSLLVRAVAHAPVSGGVVLALSDALRGELYAGCWRITGDSVVAVGTPPGAILPAALGEFGPIDVVVGSIPELLTEAVRSATGHDPITGLTALPDAMSFFALAKRTGGVTRIDHPDSWQPVYGRPAEAQAVWERTHGRSLPTATHRPL